MEAYLSASHYLSLQSRLITHFTAHPEWCSEVTDWRLPIFCPTTTAGFASSLSREQKRANNCFQHRPSQSINQLQTGGKD